MATNSKVITQTTTGARVIFKVNGTPILFANALSYNVRHDHQPLDVLDQLEPAEYTETAYLVNFSCTMFRVPFRDAIALGLRPKLKDIITQPELTVELTDTVTGATLMMIERVKCASESFNIEARSMGQVVLDFVGIRLSTEG